MLPADFPGSSPAPSSPKESKEDIRSLLLSIREVLRGIASSRLTKWAAIASIVAVPIAIMALIPALHPNEPLVPKSPLVHALEITEPPERAHVGPAIAVRGTSLLDGKRHHYYLAVNPPQGSEQIQAEPMTLSMNGELNGRAVLGTSSVGADKTFLIQILGCNSPRTSLLEAPTDCKRSKAIEVVRRY